MMQDLSLSILDIAYNSIRANASLIEIKLVENKLLDYFKIIIKDDGDGMDEETLKHVTDPFYTTRTTRKIGLGIPFFKELADFLMGEFNITSQVGVGTTTEVSMKLSHIDKPPLGNMVETLITLILASEEIDIFFAYQNDKEELVFDTRVVRDTLEGVKISTPSIINYLKEYLNDMLKDIKRN